MLGYYIRLAAKNLRQQIGLTILLMGAIGIGIGASMTMITVLHVMSGDPLPSRSARLFVPWMDPRPVPNGQPVFGDAEDALTYPDAMALLSAARGTHQAAIAGGRPLVRSSPAEQTVKAAFEQARYVTADFFPMFGVPMLSGRPLDASDIERRAHVAVIDATLSQRLFGTADGTGHRLRVGDADYDIVGITNGWRPQPLFYGSMLDHGFFGDPDTVFLPLTTAMDMALEISSTSCFGAHALPGDRHKSPNCTWLTLWVELPDAKAVTAYKAFLEGYQRDQHTHGRFPKNEPTRLYGMTAWLDHAHLAPNDLALQLWLAICFLAVCLVNIVALLMVKFMRRSGEISVRRALGARERDIFAQFAIEALVIGVGGAVAGLLVTEFGLWSVRQRPDEYANLAHLDTTMLVATVGLAIVSALLAALLPAWRACKVPPALQLKSL
jgi:putative ABC transport system permease protein